MVPWPATINSTSQSVTCWCMPIDAPGTRMPWRIRFTPSKYICAESSFSPPLNLGNDSIGKFGKSSIISICMLIQKNGAKILLFFEICKRNFSPLFSTLLIKFASYWFTALYKKIFFVENSLISVLKNFLWGKVGKYQFFFVPLQPKTKIYYNSIHFICISSTHKWPLSSEILRLD